MSCALQQILSQCRMKRLHSAVIFSWPPKVTCSYPPAPSPSTLTTAAWCLTIRYRSCLTVQSFIRAVQACGTGWYNKRPWLVGSAAATHSSPKNTLPPHPYTSFSISLLSLLLLLLVSKCFGAGARSSLLNSFLHSCIKVLNADFVFTPRNHGSLSDLLCLKSTPNIEIAGFLR